MSQNSLEYVRKQSVNNKTCLITEFLPINIKYYCSRHYKRSLFACRSISWLYIVRLHKSIPLIHHENNNVNKSKKHLFERKLHTACVELIWFWRIFIAIIRLYTFLKQPFLHFHLCFLERKTWLLALIHNHV